MRQINQSPSLSQSVHYLSDVTHVQRTPTSRRNSYEIYISNALRIRRSLSHITVLRTRFRRNIAKKELEILLLLDIYLIRVYILINHLYSLVNQEIDIRNNQK